jgi:hypothetical protein
MRIKGGVTAPSRPISGLEGEWQHGDRTTRIVLERACTQCHASDHPITGLEGE